MVWLVPFLFELFLFISLALLLWLKIQVFTLLNKRGNIGHLCLVLDFRGHVFSFTPFAGMSAIGLSYMALLCCYKSSIPGFVRDFIMERCWILSKAFPTSTEINVILDLASVYMLYYVSQLCMLNHSCIPEMKPDWRCLIFLKCCWIHFAFQWGFLNLCSAGKSVHHFPFLCIFIQFEYQHNTDFLEWVWKGFFPLCFVKSFEEHWSKFFGDLLEPVWWYKPVIPATWETRGSWAWG
jgi:hypothetical protein